MDLKPKHRLLAVAIEAEYGAPDGGLLAERRISWRGSNGASDGGMEVNSQILSSLEANSPK